MKATKKLTYEDLLIKLRNNHFYPDSVVEKNKISELHINSSPIMQEDKKERLEEILKGYPVKISKNTNHQYLVVKIIA